MRMLVAVLLMAFQFGSFAGETDVQKILNIRNAEVLRLNQKAVADLKVLAKTAKEKDEIYKAILQIDATDEEARKYVASTKDVQDSGKVVYKFWNDQKRLDFVGSGFMEKIEGENAFYKYGEMSCLLKIDQPGEYKIRAQFGEGTIKVFFCGKQVNWQSVTVLTLQKGEYPLKVVFDRPRTFDISFAPKAEPSMKVLSDPYLSIDPLAAKEVKK